MKMRKDFTVKNWIEMIEKMSECMGDKIYIGLQPTSASYSYLPKEKYISLENARQEFSEYLDCKTNVYGTHVPNNSHADLNKGEMYCLIEYEK